MTTVTIEHEGQAVETSVHGNYYFGRARCRNVFPWGIRARQSDVGLYLKLMTNLTVGGIVLDKERVIRLAAACLLSRGHLLLEDIPGIGKTTLALSLAHTLGLKFGRIQFASDLLPADITGTSVFNTKDQNFKFRARPIFRQISQQTVNLSCMTAGTSPAAHILGVLKHDVPRLHWDTSWDDLARHRDV